MDPALISFAGAWGGLIGFALLNLLVLRLPGHLAPVARQIVLALFIHVLTTALLGLLVPMATYWHGAALYWFGFSCFLYGFGAVYKSVSLRLLTELAQAPDQRIRLSTIIEDQVRPCLAARTALLVHSGLALAQQGKFTIAAQGIRMAARITLIQRFFGIQQSGLYSSVIGGTEQDDARLLLKENG